MSNLAQLQEASAALIKKREEERQQIVEGYVKKYPRQFADLEKSPLARLRSLSVSDYANLGNQLDQFMGYVQLCEENGTFAQLGTLPTLALDALTFNYGASPINAIAATQALEDVQGLVYFEDFVANVARGNVAAGQSILSTLAVPDVFPDGFAGDAVTNEEFITEVSGVNSWTDVQLGSGQSFMNPINSKVGMLVHGTAVITIGGTPHTLTFAMPVDFADEATGTFSQVQLHGVIPVSCYGTVDTELGKVSMDIFGEGATYGAIHFFADYSVAQEGNLNLASANLVMFTKTVKAQVWSLKSDFGMLEAFMLKKRLGISGEERMARNLTIAINQEIMNQAIRTLKNNIPTTGGGAKIDPVVSWKRQPQSGVDYWSHVMTLKHALADASAKIVANAGRGFGNVYIAGREAATIMSTLPGFKLLSDQVSFGPHIYGTLDGVTIVRYPYNDVLDDDTVLILYKGESPFESALCWCPYMPLVMTPTIPVAYNPLQQQRAAAVWGALPCLIPNFIAKLTIVETGFTYGSAV